MNAIEARGLSKSYGPVRALTNVSFDIDKGEVIGLLGPNGAGKTTLMKVLTGYLQPDAGTAELHGIDVVTDPIGVFSFKLGEMLKYYSPMFTSVISFLHTSTVLATMRRCDRHQSGWSVMVANSWRSGSAAVTPRRAGRPWSSSSSRTGS